MASRSASGVDLAKYGLETGTERPGRPRSAAAKGSHYKNRTKAWLEAQGWAVGFLERMMWIRRGGQPPCGACGRADMFPTKQDQFGADLIALRADSRVLFVQVKLGDSQLHAARREFARHPFPAVSMRWVVIWEKGARAPRIVDCSADTTESLGPVRRRRPDDEGKLF